MCVLDGSWLKFGAVLKMYEVLKFPTLHFFIQRIGSFTVSINKFVGYNMYYESGRFGWCPPCQRNGPPSLLLIQLMEGESDKGL
jgi:hypothetical protein